MSQTQDQKATRLVATALLLVVIAVLVCKTARSEDRPIAPRDSSDRPAVVR